MASMILILNFEYSNVFCLRFVRCEQKKQKHNLFSRCDDGAELLKHCHFLQEKFQKFLIAHFAVLLTFTDQKNLKISCG